MDRGITCSGLVALAAATGVAAALGSGCTANGGDEGILVLKNVVPTAVTGGCSFSSMETEVSLVRGSLDVALPGGYVFIAQLKSRITASSGQESLRTIFTRGANIDIAFSDASLFTAAEIANLDARNLLHFMAPFTAPISPNGGVTDVLFELIPAEVAAAIAAKSFTSVVAQTSFTVVGDLAGGDVTSQKFQYPVTITSGGLIHIAGTCASLPAAFTPRIGNPCNAGQDGVVDCCTDIDGGAVCPAVGTM